MRTQSIGAARPRTGAYGCILHSFGMGEIDTTTPLQAARKYHGGKPWVAEAVEHATNRLTKANEVGAHHSGGAGSELAGERNAMAEATAALLLQTALGRIREAVSIPLSVALAGLLADPVAYSRAEGQPLKVSAASFESVTLARARRAVLMFVTQELLAVPNVERTLAQVSLRALARELNRTTWSPSATASLTNGHSAVASGSDWQNSDYMLQEMLAELTNANAATTYFVADPGVIRGLAGLRNDLGGFAYPNVSVRDGGELLGLPLIPADGIGAGTIVAVDGAEILHGNEPVEVGVSRDARIEANSAPTGDATTTPIVGQTQIAVSLFQAGTVALKIAQFQNAVMRRPDCIAARTSFDPASTIASA